MEEAEESHPEIQRLRQALASAMAYRRDMELAQQEVARLKLVVEGLRARVVELSGGNNNNNNNQQQHHSSFSLSSSTGEPGLSLEFQGEAYDEVIIIKY